MEVKFYRSYWYSIRKEMKKKTSKRKEQNANKIQVQTDIYDFPVEY